MLDSVMQLQRPTCNKMIFKMAYLFQSFKILDFRYGHQTLLGADKETNSGDTFVPWLSEVQTWAKSLLCPLQNLT